MSGQQKSYLFGPVPSRRLGLSLGVDIVAFKVCTLDCVYCQIGRTTEKTILRREHVSVEAVLSELKEKLSGGLKADFITLSGSGEPTLNIKLGEFIDGIHQLTDIPVAVLTNGTLLWQGDVRSDCAKAELVIPSLDAGDENTFNKINRPCEKIGFEQVVEGLIRFREEFTGPIWLEVFLIDGINTDDRQISEIKTIIERIRPDKVQLNTAVRPTAEDGIEKVTASRLQAIAGQIYDKCEVIADFSPEKCGENQETTTESVFLTLKRRPCSLEDICAGLNIHRNHALKYIGQLQQQGLVTSERRDGVIFFRVITDKQP